MQTSTRTLALAALTVAVILVGCGKSTESHQAAPVKSASDRKSAYNFELKDASGKPVKLSDFKGKVILLNFWATWCSPCRIEIPWFVDFQRNYKDQGLEVIGVSMDEDGWDEVKPFISKMNMNYRILLGDDMTAEQYGGVEALPTTFLIDREGKIASTHIGLVGKDTYETEIKELLGAEKSALRRAGDRSFHALLAGTK